MGKVKDAHRRYAADLLLRESELPETLRLLTTHWTSTGPPDSRIHCPKDILTRHGGDVTR